MKCRGFAVFAVTKTGALGTGRENYLTIRDGKELKDEHSLTMLFLFVFSMCISCIRLFIQSLHGER